MNPIHLDKHTIFPGRPHVHLSAEIGGTMTVRWSGLDLVDIAAQAEPTRSSCRSSARRG